MSLRDEQFRGERAWADGRLIPRGDLAVAVGDAGFVLGATVTEQLRTFNGRLFLPDEHRLRLAESLAAVGIRPPVPLEAVFAAAQDLAAHNHAVLAAASGHERGPEGAADRGPDTGPDLGVVIFVTPGDLPAQHEGRSGGPRVVIHSFPLAFSMWARAYDHGLALRSVSVRQVPEACWPVHAKVRSRLHYFLADREAQAIEPGTRAVLAHLDGRISETSTANVAIVADRTILEPPPADALAGVSLAHARRLAEAAGFTWRERSLVASDLAAADEILLTSTPTCLLAVTRFDGRPVGRGSPGPIHRRLLAAWSRGVALDIAAQARAALDRTAGAGAPTVTVEDPAA
jgi:branched-subunit amino acid aminotransferase/4-amino-4-deoxychorismate lyase